MARPRSEAKRVVELLEASQNPIYIVDDRRRVTFCNAACEEWLGVDRDELLGLRCDYHAGDSSQSKPERAATALCPSPEVFVGLPVEGPVVWRGSGEVVSQRLVRFTPLGRDANCPGVLAVVATSDGFPNDATEILAEDLTSADLHQQLLLMVQQQADRFRLEQQVGESAEMRRVREQARIAILTDAPVAITGPTGSGREHLARSIHAARESAAASPLLPISCTSIDAQLLQATLLAFLDHCREIGAPSNATVLLLDGDQLESAAQTELLGFLSLPTVDLRTIVTARQPLRNLAAEDQLDADLALLLSALDIELPALADRRGDIPLLAQQILECVNARGERQFAGFSPQVLDRLGSMPWKKNLDELTEIVEQTCLNAAGPVIEETDLPERVNLLISAATYPSPVPEEIQLDPFLEDVERELLLRAMRYAGGNKAKAARALGIPRNRLLRRLTQLGLEKD